MTYRCSPMNGRNVLLALVAALALLATACGGDEEVAPQPTAPIDISPSPGGEGLLDGGEELPSPGTATPGEAAETGEPPEQGETTATESEQVAQGTDPTDERPAPVILLATTPEQGAAAAAASPAPGAAAVLRDWDQYEERSLVAVLAGAQPDPSYRLALRSVSIIKNGELLVVSGKITRKGEVASAVVSIPWVVLSVDAEKADTVSRCTLNLEAVTPLSTSCP